MFNFYCKFIIINKQNLCREYFSALQYQIATNTFPKNKLYGLKEFFELSIALNMLVFSNIHQLTGTCQQLNIFYQAILSSWKTK